MDGDELEAVNKAEILWRSAKNSERLRAESMPKEEDALSLMWSAYQRLKELGWKESIYAPQDGTIFKAIEPGSTGIHDCTVMKNSKGRMVGFWGPDGDDLWPMKPILWKHKKKK